MEEDLRFMQRCHQLAEMARAEGESAVGSILVRNGKVIGEGGEKSRQLNDVTRHAEVVAILDALNNNHDVNGATLYTNVEPCMLCSYMIRHHRIARVVFEEPAGTLGGAGGACQLLTKQIDSWAAPPEIKQIR